MFDLIIQNGEILDGNGGEAFSADIAVEDGKIAAVGKSLGGAKRTIDAAGKTVTPGFIDIHRHADAALLRPGFGKAELAQGLTTIVNGNCGLSLAPVSGPHRAAVLDYLAPIMGRMEADFSQLADYRRLVNEAPLPLNAGILTGMGTLRACAAGFQDGPLSDDEYRRLHVSLEQALSDGALGVSLGLGYAPECFYTTDQLIRALAPLRRSGQVITVHMRQEGDGVVEALAEMLTVARALETPLQISHLKAIGPRNWRRAVPQMLQMIAGARAEGLDVACDAYPHLAGSTQLIHVLPPEFQAGGVEALTAALGDPESRRRMRQRMETGTDFENIVSLVGFENIHAISLRLPEHGELEGRTLADIAKRQGKDPYDALFDLLAAERCGPAMIDFFAHQADVEDILRTPFAGVISDATYPEGLLHPRVYGAFPRLLETCVGRRGVLTLEEAVHKITRQPADRFGLTGKGRIETGTDADLCLFAPENIHETATWQNPRQLAEGMDWVFVNGVPAIQEGQFTGLRAGRHL